MKTLSLLLKLAGRFDYSRIKLHRYTTAAQIPVSTVHFN